MTRSLTLREREVLLAVIANGSEFGEPVTAIDGVLRDEWRRQAATVQVSGTCSCGMCPTINLDPLECRRG